LDFDIYNDQKDINLNKSEKVEFIKFDIRNTNLIDEHLKDVDHVIILAGLVGEFITKKYPKLSKEINEDSIINLIDKVDKFKNIQNLIFVSTCSNYGITKNNILVNEDYSLNPLSPYAKAKVKIENYLLNKKNISYAPTILRFATAFGLSPRMRFDLTVNHFCYSMIKDKQIEVFDPKTWRPYCHVRDFSNLIQRVLEIEVSRTDFEIFNAGGDRNNLTKRNIVEIIATHIPDLMVDFVSGGSDPRNYIVDFSKVKTQLCFEPIWSVEDGIKEIINLLEQGLYLDLKKDKDFYGNYNIENGS